MAPTIRVDDDLYALLKEHAEPFVDSPNTVLRRLLNLPPHRSEVETTTVNALLTKREANRSDTGSRRKRTSRARKGQRATKGTLLPLEEYELPLLQVLVDQDGRAPSRNVLDAVGERLNGKLTQVDHERIGSGGIRWRNRAQFARLHLVELGDMAKDSPRGLWEITDQGRARVRSHASS